MQILELLFSFSSFYDRTYCCKEDDQDENTESKQHRKHAKNPLNEEYSNRSQFIQNKGLDKVCEVLHNIDIKNVKLFT